MIAHKYDLKSKSRSLDKAIYKRQYFSYFCKVKLGIHHENIALLVDQQRTTQYNSVKKTKKKISIGDEEWSEITKDIREDLSKCPINKVVVFDRTDEVRKAFLILGNKYFNNDISSMKKFVNSKMESKKLKDDCNKESKLITLIKHEKK